MREDEMAMSHLRICKPRRRRRSERLAVACVCMCVCVRADAGMSQTAGADGRAPQLRPGYPAAASPRAADLHTAASPLHNRAGPVITAGSHIQPASSGEGDFFLFLVFFLYFPNTNNCSTPSSTSRTDVETHGRTSAAGQVDVEPRQRTWTRISK